MHLSSSSGGRAGSLSTGDRSVANNRTLRHMLRTLLLVASGASGCVVQGGEENHQTDTAIVGLIRYEAKNQDGVTVGSGCTVHTGETGERIHFSAAPGDRIELTERYEMVVDQRASVDQHGLDDAFWCSRQSQGLAYDQPVDGRCLKTVGGKSTEPCFLGSDWVGRASSAQLIPPDAELKPGKVLGFSLQIDVLANGKQCAVWQCADETPAGAFVAFVVDKP